MKTEIFLIRHAEPFKYNAPIDEEPQVKNEKIPLSKIGEKQASLLSENQNLNNFDLVISSNYVRAISTAKYLLNENTEFIVDPSFNERKMGTEEKTKEFWLDQLYDENVKCIDGESQKEVRKRMFCSIEKILKGNKYKKIAIVTHATAMTFLLMKWCKLENAQLEGKKRTLSFNDAIVISDKFNTPEVFKLTFNNSDIISIERIIL